MRKKLFKAYFAFVFFILAVSLKAGQDNRYQFSVDLTRNEKDLLTVDLIVPKSESNEAVYRLPAMVPGTYAIYDFGRFVSGFSAFDADGRAIPFSHPDVNSWKITDARNLYRISYRVEDTWDTSLDSNWIFEPAGTNFNYDTNFVINTHGLFGYFDGMLRNTYSIRITHNPQLFGATGLSNIQYEGNTDIFTVPDYMTLVDGPILYCRPDTSHLRVGETDVLISVYSPHGLVKSKFLAETLQPLLDAQRQYLGGTLPVKNYAFLVYLSENGFRSGASGALEHSYSSLYCLMEVKPDMIAQNVRDVAAHEFFHIVTPLNIHSHEIGDFDYDHPKMSQHLWMYEGLTEYAASHVQVKYGKMELDEFLDVLSDKMDGASAYIDTLPFTTMSKEALGKYKEQYNNVYEKGALIGMCLDLRLRQLSDGKYGTQDMMRDLSKTYGKDKSFNDDELFATIEKLTYPEIGDFFRNYVYGKKPLPYGEMLGLAGINYKDSVVTNDLTLGGISIGVNSKKQLVVADVESMNAFGKKMGYREGDIFISFNGTPISPANAREVIGGFMSTAKPGDKIVIVMGHEKPDGKITKRKLKGHMRMIRNVDRFVLSENKEATPAQLKLRKDWIGK